MDLLDLHPQGVTALLDELGFTVIQKIIARIACNNGFFSL